MIDFFTFISRNSADYAEYLRSLCIKNSSGIRINWKCIESVNADRIPNGFNCVAKSGDYGHNSLNHAMAMKEALNHIENDFVVFSDVDIAITYKNWDRLICDILNKNDCFGFAYNDGPWYQNFPSVLFFCFTKSMVNNITLDFRPKLIDNVESVVRYEITDPTEANYFNKKIGQQIKCDTGWRLPLIIRSAGYNGIPIMPGSGLLPYTDAKNKKFCLQKPSHMGEWHWNNKLFGSHKQASRSHALNSEWGIAWKSRIDKFVMENDG